MKISVRVRDWFKDNLLANILYLLGKLIFWSGLFFLSTQIVGYPETAVFILALFLGAISIFYLIKWFITLIQTINYFINKQTKQ